MSILTAYNKFIQQALKYGFSLWGTAKTGQTVQYYTPDDGTWQKGYPKAPPRFKDNGDGTITDNATGLMWVKEPGACGGAFGTPGNPATMDWTVALDECDVLDYAGHSDWRLPNIKELISIADYSEHDPSIDGTFFPDTIGGYYWVSTTFAPHTVFAWLIYFLDGAATFSDKTGSYHVRPVRLGVPKD